jgi:hypothetical protein
MSARFLVVGLLAVTTGVRADPTTPSTDPLGDWAKTYNLSLRQSVVDKNALEKPAAFQWVHAGSGDSSSIDVGLTWSALNSTDWSAGPLVEYHRQTLAVKKQDNFQAGLTALHVIGDVTDKSTITQFLQGTLNWKNDRVVIGSGGLCKATDTLLYPELGLGRTIGPDYFKVEWQPTAGLEYETASNVLKSGRKGATARAYGNLEIGIYPLAKSVRRAIELMIRGTYWRDFSGSSAYTTLFRRNHTLAQLTLTYYFDPNQHFAVALDRTSGENPEQGLQQQNTTTLSLKVKL